MADLKTIKGFKVESLATDPSVIGQVYYNTASNTLKYVTTVGAWATGGTANQLRGDVGSASSGNTQTAAIAFGGYYNPVGNMANAETYNGTAWTAITALPAARAGIRGLGTSTAALAVDGDNVGYKNDCYEWDGSSWTAGGSTTTYRRGASCAGTQTSGLVTLGSGKYPSTTPGQGTRTEEYDGTSWTAGGDQLFSAGGSSGTGTQTSAINTGSNPPHKAETQTYDGSSWTEVGDLNNGRDNGAGWGTQTAMMFAGGDTGSPQTTFVETYDGSTWTETTNFSTPRGPNNVGGGTTTVGLLGFGYAPVPAGNFSNATEEWTVGPTTKTVTAT